MHEKYALISKNNNLRILNEEKSSNHLIAPVKANSPLNGTWLNDKNFVQCMNSIKQPEHQDKVYFLSWKLILKFMPTNSNNLIIIKKKNEKSTESYKQKHPSRGVLRSVC